jgi:vacuolar-type H+-ATPase subunit I/STV1
LTALRRVGITFSDEQEELIKSFVATNDVASAQGVILEELESQFGGVARAAAETATGSMVQFKNAVGDLKEDIGGLLAEALAPVVSKLTDWITKFREVRAEAAEVRKAQEELAEGIDVTSNKLFLEQKELENLRAEYEAANEVLATTNFRTAAYRRRQENLVNGLYEQVLAQEEVVQGLQELGERQGEYNEKIEETVELVEEVKQEEEELTQVIAQEIIDRATAAGEYYKNLAEAQKFAAEYAEQLAEEETEKLLEEYDKRADAAETVLGYLTDAAGLVGEAMATGEDASKAFAKSAVLAFAKVIDSLAELAIAEAIVAAAEQRYLKAAGLAAAGVTAKVAAAAVKAEANSFQSGTGSAGFTVPPGYEQDNFPVFASSGETVRVDRAGTGGGSMQPIILQIDGRKIGQVLADLSDAGGMRINPRVVRA